MFISKWITLPILFMILVIIAGSPASAETVNTGVKYMSGSPSLSVYISGIMNLIQVQILHFQSLFRIVVLINSNSFSLVLSIVTTFQTQRNFLWYRYLLEIPLL